MAKKPLGLRRVETPAKRVASRKAEAVSGLDRSSTSRRNGSAGRPKRKMDGRRAGAARRLVGVANHRLERRDHVADHVFGRVVQQDRRAAPALSSAGLTARDGFDQQRMLRDGEDMRTVGLAVPARHPRQTHGRCPRSRYRAARGRAGRAVGPDSMRCQARGATAVRWF